jgi:hypothetical protein
MFFNFFSTCRFLAAAPRLPAPPSLGHAGMALACVTDTNFPAGVKESARSPEPAWSLSHAFRPPLRRPKFYTCLESRWTMALFLWRLGRLVDDQKVTPCRQKLDQKRPKFGAKLATSRTTFFVRRSFSFNFKAVLSPAVLDILMISTIKDSASVSYSPGRLPPVYYLNECFDINQRKKSISK